LFLNEGKKILRLKEKKGGGKRGTVLLVERNYTNLSVAQKKGEGGHAPNYD